MKEGRLLNDTAHQTPLNSVRLRSAHLQHRILHRRQSTGTRADTLCLGGAGVALAKDRASSDDNHVTTADTLRMIGTSDKQDGQENGSEFGIRTDQ